MSRMTKPFILFLNRNAAVGGGERSTMRLIQLAHDSGYGSALACAMNGPLPDFARGLGIDVVEMRFDWMQRTLRLDKLLRYIRHLRSESEHVKRLCIERNARIIHANEIVSAMYGVRAARDLGIPLLVHMRGAKARHAHSWLAHRYVSPAATRYLAVSQAVRRTLLEHGIDDARIQVLYNGVDPRFLVEPPPKPIPLDGAGPHIGIFGLITPIKGHHVLLEAVKPLIRRWPGVQVHIVGSAAHEDDISYEAKVRAQAADPALGGRVHFHGFSDEIPRWMAAMDVVALCTTIPEALPNSVLEAMALGTLVVGTAHGGTVEIIEDKVTGRLVPPCDVPALSEALDDLLSRPENDPMHDRARALVRQKFHPDENRRRVRQVWEELMGGDMGEAGSQGSRDWPAPADSSRLGHRGPPFSAGR
jgi:glycosyltransferase involved in cell wall biosynthesis